MSPCEAVEGYENRVISLHFVLIVLDRQLGCRHSKADKAVRLAEELWLES